MPKKSILITGASTGIGHDCAVQLCQQGFRVFAGVRKEKDHQALLDYKYDDLIPLYLDVTQDDHIQQAYETVSNQVGDDGLYGLINNAGIVVMGPVEILGLEHWRRQLDVNVMGTIAVTQRFLPLLKKAEGRIVLIGSIAGRSTLPFASAYSVSKYALEALGDALRVELKPWNIKTSIIEPGAVKTPIWVKSREDAEGRFKHISEERLGKYKSPIGVFRELAQKAEERAISTDVVIRAISHALTARRPKPRYLLGTDAKLRILLDRLPTRWKDYIFARLFKV